MSTVAEETEDQIHEEHTSPAQYVAIAGVLCMLTVMEIVLYYQEASIPRGVLLICLFGIAGIKFFLVAAYFMHLKDDPKLFRRWFIVGGLAALGLFTYALVTLNIQDQRFF